MATDNLFNEVLDFPNPEAQARFAKLVGLDNTKQRLVNEAVLLLDKDLINNWSQRHHGGTIAATEEMTSRSPLIILAGDVGTGKTELAETFVDEVARKMRVEGTLYELSLSARGKGAVGEMTSLIGNAFKTVADETPASQNGGRISKISALLIDEGDSLAQSREATQMHHEDRAGVNALIKGVDGLRRKNIPTLVILCTNRIDAIDPAVKRRAAHIAILSRPNDEQRQALLSDLLAGVTLNPTELLELTRLTGQDEANGRLYGFTYSDIRQRLVPEAIMLAATRDVPLSYSIFTEVLQTVQPTRPFEEAGK